MFARLRTSRTVLLRSVNAPTKPPTVAVVSRGIRTATTVGSSSSGRRSVSTLLLSSLPSAPVCSTTTLHRGHMASQRLTAAIVHRCYAKKSKKGGKKGKKGGKGAAGAAAAEAEDNGVDVAETEDEMSFAELDEALDAHESQEEESEAGYDAGVVQEQMQRTTDYLQRVLAGMRTGRASAGMLDGVTVSVKAYGSEGPLVQFAQVSANEPTQLTVNAFDPNTVDDIAAAIRSANLGLNPQPAQGSILRVPIPRMTSEQRAKLAKVCGERGEEAKIRLRRIRQRALKLLAKDKSSRSEDDIHRDEKQVQEIIDGFVQQVDAAVKAKQDEILDV